MRQIKLEDAQAYDRELKALEEQKAQAKKDDTVPTNMMMEQLMKNAGMLEQPSPYAVNSSHPVKTAVNVITNQQYDKVAEEEDTNSNTNMQYGSKEEYQDRNTATSSNSSDVSSSNNTVREGYEIGRAHV